jgi:sugar transferase (PEP-CTERM/EpsH1 system associated)
VDIYYVKIIMNILIVCRSLPYPPDVGVNIRLYNLIKNLANKHNISIMCYAGFDDQKTYLSKLKEYCESIILVPRKKKSKISQLPILTANLFAGLPWNIKYSKSKEMRNSIFERTKAHSFDIVHIDDIFMASNLDFAFHYNFKKVVTFHNLESINYKRIFKVEKNPYEKLLSLLNWLAMRSWENKIIEIFDLSVAVSPIELRILKSMNTKAKVAFIPNGVDIKLFNFLPFTDNEGDLLFIGNMDYAPNIDGAIYFVKKIFPLIKKKLPKAKLWIVGQNPKKAIKRLASDPSIIVTGYVQSVIPYYEKSSVAVVPLRAGGGTRGKILEAMALGRPVVSTSLGAEGLEVTDKVNIMISDKDEKFTDNIIEIITNKTLRKNITDNARRFVESHYNWKKAAAELDRAYREISVKT